MRFLHFIVTINDKHSYCLCDFINTLQLSVAASAKTMGAHDSFWKLGC